MFASGSLLLGGSVRFAHTARKNHSTGNSGSGIMDQYSMILYASYLAQSGFYADLVLHSGLYDEEFKGRTNNGDYAADSKYWTRGGGVSAEIGRRFSLENAGGAWFAEPQMQLSYYRIHGKNFTSTSGMRVSQSSVNSLVGRVGIFAGVERETGRNYRKDAAVQFTYRYSF